MGCVFTKGYRILVYENKKEQDRFLLVGRKEIDDLVNYDVLNRYGTDFMCINCYLSKSTFTTLIGYGLKSKYSNKKGKYFDFRFRLPKIEHKKEFTKEILFGYNQERHKISVVLDSVRLEMLNDYPFSSLKEMYEVPMPEAIEES